MLFAFAMRLRSLAVGSVFVGVILGCGGELGTLTWCNNLSSALTTARKQEMPCGTPSANLPFEGERCEDVIVRCTKPEQNAIASYAACLKKLPACSPGSEGSFTAAVRQCSQLVSGVAQACQP